MIPSKAQKALNGIWLSRADFEAWWARGWPAFSEELRARISALNPRSDAPNPLERSRAEMTPEIDGLRWDNFQRLEHKSYYLATGAKLRDDGRADWRGTHTYLQAFSGLLMGYFDMNCIPLFVHCAFRDKMAQDAMRQTGMSKLGWPLSGHNRGYAVDIVHGRFAWDLTRREWNAIGAVGKYLWDAYMQQLPPDQRLEIEWGGDWSNPWDPAHWEIKGFEKLPFNQQAADVYNSSFMPARFTRKQLVQKGRDFAAILSGQAKAARAASRS